MKNRLPTLAAAALFAMSMVPLANNASALPADALALKNVAPTTIETVRWRGHRGWGPGVSAAVLGGAIIGGILAAPYYGDDPYAYEPYLYGYGPGPISAPVMVGTRWPTACSGSGRMIRTAAPMSGSMACVIPVRERIVTAACAFPAGRNYRHWHTSQVRGPSRLAGAFDAGIRAAICAESSV
jgi:hypothetical protein